MIAWHFVGDTLRDGRPVPPDGETLRHEGELVMCESGLHASVRALDALRYAPGSFVCRVQMGGEIIEDADKLVASERTILWRADATEALTAFARLCALDVAHLWDMPKIMRRYLETGDEEIRDAAWDAARAAAWDAAWDAARDAARAAAWDAARDAARAAAWAAARAAARDAARAAAWAAAWAAARAAAWDAARAAQNESLEAMLEELKC